MAGWLGLAIEIDDLPPLVGELPSPELLLLLLLPSLVAFEDSFLLHAGAAPLQQGIDEPQRQPPADLDLHAQPHQQGDCEGGRGDQGSQGRSAGGEDREVFQEGSTMSSDDVCAREVVSLPF